MMNIDNALQASSRLNLLNLPCGHTTCKDMSSHQAYSPKCLEGEFSELGLSGVFKSPVPP
jgi:hypothetical protein